MRISITGDTLLSRAIPYEPVPVTNEERDWWFKEFAAVMAGDYTVGRPRYLQLDEAARNRARRDAAEMLWKIAYADGRLDKYEDSLVLKISDLLHVSRGRVMKLKHDAEIDAS